MRPGFRWFFVMLFAALAACGRLNAHRASGAGASSTTVLSNGLISVAFDNATGRVAQVADLRRNPSLNLLGAAASTPPAPGDPFEIFQIGKDASGKFLQVVQMPVSLPKAEFRRLAADHLQIVWALPAGPTVTADWRLTDGAAEASATATIAQLGGRQIYSLRYPIFYGLAPLSGDGSGDTYLTSWEGGVLMNQPLARLADEIRDGSYSLRSHHYPLGHEAMAQLVAYMHPGLGGVLLYTADPTFAVKDFELDTDVSAKQAIPVWRVEHLNSDVAGAAQRGAFAVAYPTVLHWLDVGAWDEAADVYRTWSDGQPWAAAPLAQRAPAEQEFFERLGASVFGVSSRVDQRPWIEGFRTALTGGLSAAQLLFVLGWDFHRLGDPEPARYLSMQQAGHDEIFWAPFVGSTADNVAQAQGQGDLAALFLYDIAIDSAVPGWHGFSPPPGDDPHDPAYLANSVLVDETGRPGAFSAQDPLTGGWVFTLDPASATVADFWRWRDSLVVNALGRPLDALYFDFGFAVANYGDYAGLCGRADGHPAGAGQWYAQGARNALDAPCGTPNPRGFRYGAENATEPYADLVDFWHLGASGDGPLRDKVANSQPPAFTGADGWIVAGLAVQVPLMAYLRHHLGAVRTGGKMTVSEDLGDVFYWIVAAEYVWGGVVELSYFNTPLDWLPSLNAKTACTAGHTACGFQTDWGQGLAQWDRGWQYDGAVHRADPDKLAFLRTAMSVRTASPAQPYLTLGRMEPTPQLDPAPANASFSYSYYFSINGSGCDHAGQWQAQPLQVAAWRHPYENNVALLVANAADQAIEANLVFDPANYNLPQAKLSAISLTDGSATPLSCAPDANGHCHVPLTVPPRTFQMVELAP